MSQNEIDSQTDEWSEWLLHGRHADDPSYELRVRAATKRIADRVLDDAILAPGMTITDIGTGDGLVAFNAIDRIGPSLRLILTDISAPMLHHVKTLATERRVVDQCTFLQCSAEKLDGIPDASVDVVVTRAVLAYVPDKLAALREFHRILKPGGRISIAEPILRDDAIETVAIKKLLDSQSLEAPNRFLSIMHRWKSSQFPDTEEKMANSPLANYSERDLVRLVQGTGFSEIHMSFQIDILPSIIISWDNFLGYTPHPWAPTVRSILAEQCTVEERQLFEQLVRPIVESGQSSSVERVAYLNAMKTPA